MRWVLLAVCCLAFLLAGCATPTPQGQATATTAPGTSTSEAGASLGSTTGLPTAESSVCPGHWHATFAIYIPDNAAQPQKVDFAGPKTGGGLPYYDYSASVRGGDAKMTAALHMHQAGSEVGSASLGPTQWHMESDGLCMSVAMALHIVDVDASTTSLRLYGGHDQVANQHGTFTAAGDVELRWWVEERNSDGGWAWHETGWGDIGSRQLLDGESLLVALGHYTEDQVQTMQSSIPAPIRRT